MQNKKKPVANATGFFNYGALGRIRTSDRLVRSQVLYPAELRAHKAFFQGYMKIHGGEGGIRTLDTATNRILP